MYNKVGQPVLVMAEADKGDLDPLPLHKQTEVKPKRKR
jgi:hypothetical protein